jgi:SAM-dependent methyltransferase
MYLYPYYLQSQLSELYGRSYFTADSQDNEMLGVPVSVQVYDYPLRRKKFEETIAELMALRKNAKNILDIGAATGDFLNSAKKFNLDVVGIELSEYAAAEAKKKYGLDLIAMDIADYKSPEAFDLIHLNHVFEHFINPNPVINKIHNLTKIGGLVYIEVPFQFNIVELLKLKLLGKKNDFNMFSIHHPIFYRPKILIDIFNRAGFRCVSINVFRWSRYPANNIPSYIKKMFWMFASLLGQGTQIEAIFERIN